jgi:hypothetical protein
MLSAFKRSQGCYISCMATQISAGDWQIHLQKESQLFSFNENLNFLIKIYFVPIRCYRALLDAALGVSWTV